jgi:hypothetical protein
MTAEDSYRKSAGDLPHKRPVHAVLILCEAALVFALGIFGNKVADALKISVTVVVIGAAATIILLYVVTLARLRFETGERILPDTIGIGLARRFQHAVITVFPGGIVIGIVLGSLFVLGLAGRMYSLGGRFLVHDYELVAFLAGAVLLFIIGKHSVARPPLLAFAAGYGLGIAAMVELLSPRGNSPLMTFVSTPLATLSVSIIISSGWFKRLIKSFENEFNSPAE